VPIFIQLGSNYVSSEKERELFKPTKKEESSRQLSAAKRKQPEDEQVQEQVVSAKRTRVELEDDGAIVLE
jgi:hypothetical protein